MKSALKSEFGHCNVNCSPIKELTSQQKKEDMLTFNNSMSEMLSEMTFTKYLKRKTFMRTSQTHVLFFKRV